MCVKISEIEIKEKLRKVILKIAKIPLEYNANLDEMSLIDDLFFDSISIIELIVEIEEEFNISIDYDDLNFERFNDVVNIEELILSYLRDKHEI